jgi:FSR family fosmidomycin resistance protein-like MFS transporter
VVADEEDHRVKHRGWLGLHPSIWKVASTHVVVDAYTNIYAPLLPLLIPRLNLSLMAAGTIAMCFQMANSVSQLGFGALADRWQPRTLVIVGPLVTVIVLSFVGVASTPLMLGTILVLGGLGGAAFHPAAAALVYRVADQRKGLAMSTHLSGGSLDFQWRQSCSRHSSPRSGWRGLRW